MAQKIPNPSYFRGYDGIDEFDEDYETAETVGVEEEELEYEELEYDEEEY